jgi:UDP-N-acetyl-D-galactosamine dehydrogenase
VIENTQRDVNIALVNELALIFNRLGIDTLEVLEAAATEWNFLPFRPGLVGGHCVGVARTTSPTRRRKSGIIPRSLSPDGESMTGRERTSRTRSSN